MKSNIKKRDISFVREIKDLGRAIKAHWNLRTIVFLLCSIISAFINLVFITNLTKSAYTIGTVLSVPAAILLGLLSIGLDFAKVLHVVQVNSLSELYQAVKGKFVEQNTKRKDWTKRIKNVRNKWFAAYLFYVILSIITSVSLSTISIGSGITRNANTLKQIDGFIIQGETYYNISDTTKNMTIENTLNKARDTSEEDAIRFMNQQVSNVWPRIEDYINERTEFEKDYSVNSTTEMTWQNSTIVPSKYWDDRNADINRYIVSSMYSQTKLTGGQIKAITLGKFQSTVKANYLTANQARDNTKAVETLNTLNSDTMDEAYNWIEELNNTGLVNPRTGEVVVFDTDKTKQTKVLISSALTRLKALRVDVENDSGDIGSSSKIFMQLGSTIDQKKNNANTDLDKVVVTKTDGSFGTTEVMMMLMLLFLSLLCELAINQFSPRSPLTREMLDNFMEYFPIDFDINRFLLEVLIRRKNFGEITDEEFDSECQRCCRMMGITPDTIIKNYEDEQVYKKVSSRKKEKVVVTPKVEPVIPVKEEPVNIKKERKIIEEPKVENVPIRDAEADALIEEMKSLVGE